jgi:chromosome segregation ATPase
MPTELEALQLRVEEADHRAMAAEVEVERLREALRHADARARDAEARARAAREHVTPLQTELQALRAELDRTRASEANCFGRIIDRGRLLDIKQLIRECNADHRAEVERLLARIRQAKEAQSNLEALVSQQSALISHLRTTWSRSSRA